MPSRALGKFEGPMMRDVDRIIDTHANIQAGNPGNRGLGHLTRAGVLFLCAAWELYIEEVLIETVEYCIGRCTTPNELPQSVQRRISNHVLDSKHELKPLEMAGDGWKTIYREIAQEWVVALNTPKNHNIDRGFQTLVGLENLSATWSLGAESINGFVEARGDVAHRGSDAGNIQMNVLRNTYKVQVSRCVLETDNALATFVRNNFHPRRYPWNRRNLDV